MIDALAAWLEGRAELPDALAWLAGHVEADVLRRLCRGNALRSYMAAKGFLDAFERVDPTSAEQARPLHTQPDTTSPSSAAAELARPTYIQPADPLRGPNPAGASSAIADANGAVLRVLALEEDIARLAPFVGIGWHREGTALVDVVHDRLADLERLLARAPHLRAIADLVGRMDAAQRKGRRSERGGRESVVSVTTGGELADVLPSELALLGDPATEDLFLLRLAERRLLSLELDGDQLGAPSDPERKGPALVCVDTSGSMIGAAEELGKAATLAILRRVLGEGRRAEVALFGGAGSMKTVVFRPGNTSLRALFDLMMTSYHGGTDFDAPLAWALARRAEALPTADVLIVSDARGRLRPATLGRLQAARRGPIPLRIVFVHVDPTDGGRARGDLGPFQSLTDEVVHVRNDGTVTRVVGGVASASSNTRVAKNR